MGVTGVGEIHTCSCVWWDVEACVVFLGRVSVFFINEVLKTARAINHNLH